MFEVKAEIRSHAIMDVCGSSTCPVVHCVDERDHWLERRMRHLLHADDEPLYQTVMSGVAPPYGKVVA
jgi:hypothetical protein